jgi:hypothetical protein
MSHSGCFLPRSHCVQLKSYRKNAGDLPSELWLDPFMLATMCILGRRFNSVIGNSPQGVTFQETVTLSLVSSFLAFHKIFAIYFIAFFFCRYVSQIMVKSVGNFVCSLFLQWRSLLPLQLKFPRVCRCYLCVRDWSYQNHQTLFVKEAAGRTCDFRSSEFVA